MQDPYCTIIQDGTDIKEGKSESRRSGESKNTKAKRQKRSKSRSKIRRRERPPQDKKGGGWWEGAGGEGGGDVLLLLLWLLMIGYLYRVVLLLPPLLLLQLAAACPRARTVHNTTTTYPRHHSLQPPSYRPIVQLYCVMLFFISVWCVFDAVSVWCVFMGGGGAVQVCCKFGLILGQCFLYALLVCGDVQEGAGWGSCYFTGGSYGVVSVCKRVNWGIQVAFCACGA